MLSLPMLEGKAQPEAARSAFLDATKAANVYVNG